MEELFATEKTRALVPRIKEFLENEVLPHEKDAMLTGKFSTVAKILDQKRELVKKAGLWGLQWSKEEGGLGLSLCEIGRAHV